MVAMALRAQKDGNERMIDFHYSDSWADPGKQFKPAAWEKLFQNY
jgi:arabinogalactan endo-1,4-beta-galactosidase